MQMLNTFLQALIVFGTIVCVTYYLLRFTAYGVLCLIGKLSFKLGDDAYQHADRTALRMLPKGWGKRRLHFVF